tara:strand:- start:338 stop:685 length:348 start_codon:yes stop_codon:yes gene_type:complete
MFFGIKEYTMKEGSIILLMFFCVPTSTLYGYHGDSACIAATTVILFSVTKATLDRGVNFWADMTVSARMGIVGYHILLWLGVPLIRGRLWYALVLYSIVFCVGVIIFFQRDPDDV